MKNLKFWKIIGVITLVGVGLQVLMSYSESPKISTVTIPIANTNSTQVDSLLIENTIDSTYEYAIEHLKSYEGFRSQIYLDVDGSRTIGYGHHLLKGENYQNISEATATDILKRDLDSRLEVIKERYNVSGDTLLALGLFSFNCGLGTLDNAINNGILTKPENILSYCHYKTYDEQRGVIWHTSNKLLKRRKYELALITNKD